MAGVLTIVLISTIVSSLMTFPLMQSVNKLTKYVDYKFRQLDNPKFKNW